MLMADDDKVSVGIEADASNLKEGMAEATTANKTATESMRSDWAATAPEIQAMVKEMGASIKETMAGIKESVIGFQEAIVGIGAVMAGGAIFGEVLNKTTEFAEGVELLSTKLGISAEDASVLDVALQHVGITAQQYAQGAQAIARSLANNSKAFQGLDISVRNGDGTFKNSQSIMQEVIAKLGDMKAGTDRNVAAVEIMKRSHMDINALLRLTSDTMDMAAKKAESLGLVMSEQGLNKAVQYKMSLNDLSITGEALAMSIGNVVIPVLVDFSTFIAEIPAAIREAISAISDWTDSHQALVGTVETVIEAIGIATGIWATYRLGILAAAAAHTVWAAITIALDAIIVTTTGVVEVCIGAFEAFTSGAWLASAAETAMTLGLNLLIGSVVIVGVAVAALYAAWTTNFNGIKTATDNTVNAIAQVFSRLAEHIKSICNSIANAIHAALVGDWEGVKAAWGSMVGDWSGAMKDIGDIASNTWDLVSTITSKAIGGIKDKIKGVMSGIGGAAGGGPSTPEGDQNAPTMPGPKGPKGKKPPKDHSAEDAKKAAEAVLQAKKDEIEQEEALDKLYVAEHKITALQAAQDDVKFLQQVADTAKAQFGEQSKEYAEAKTKELEAAAKVAEEEQKAADKIYATKQKYLELSLQLSDLDVASQEEDIKHKAAMGQISAASELAALNNLENQKRQARLNEYNEEITLLQQLQKDYPAAFQEIADKIIAIQNQILVAKKQNTLDLKTQDDKQEQNLKKPWIDLATQVQSTFSEIIASVVERTSTIKQAFQKMANDILNGVVKIFAQNFTQQFTNLFQKTTTSANQMGSGASQALTQVGQSSQTAAVSIWNALWPLLLMAGLMDIMKGGSSSSNNQGRNTGSFYGNSSIGNLPSYDVGSWSVPGDMVARVHQNELIVPAKGGMADTVRGILSGQTSGPGGAAGGGGNFTHAPTYNVQAIDGKSMGRIMRDNSRDVTQGLYRASRNQTRNNVSRWGL
jgi:hypothetical protein